MSLGKKIRNLREESNMTQNDLANKSGISRVAIGNYERDERKPNIEILKSIAKALDVPIVDIIEDSCETKTNKEIYKAMTDNEITRLLEPYGFLGDVFANASSEEKESFIDSVSDISPLKLKAQDYLNNFDKFNKQDLLDVYNDAISYYSKIIKTFVDEQYTPLVQHLKRQEEQIKALEMIIKSNDDIIKLQKQRLDNIDSILNNYPTKEEGQENK